MSSSMIASQGVYDQSESSSTTSPAEHPVGIDLTEYSRRMYLHVQALMSQKAKDPSAATGSGSSLSSNDILADRKEPCEG